MSGYLSIRDIDWTLLIIVLLICSVGVLQIYSATIDTGFHSAWWKQIVYVAGGLLLMWLAIRVDYHSLMHHVPLLYISSIVLLLATALIGDTVFGSRRWIPLPGGAHFQVSEFVKLVIILLVARYLTDLKKDDLEIGEMLKLAGLVAVPMALVLKQPDLGTSLTYIAILVTGAFLAGLRWKYVAAIAVVAVLVLPVGWHFLKDYQKARLVSFMDPDRDPQGTGYQLIQSQIAVGAGGMFGKGVTKGTQTQLRFSARAAHGFHLLGLCRGAWIRGRGCSVVVVFRDDHAHRPECADGARSGRHVYLYGCSRSAAVSHAGECGNGGGTDAGDRYSASLHERRGFQCLVEFFGIGAGE